MTQALIEEYEAIIKAKDDEIAELKLDFDMQKKSDTEMYRKNEDIDMLKESESHFFNALIDERKQRLSLFDCLKKERKKARSIVAMLFWESKKYSRMAGEIENEDIYSCRTYNSKWIALSKSFKQAYKMLKESK